MLTTTPRADGSHADLDEKQRETDERGWCYYLSEISIRRTVDEILNLLYRHGEEYWMKNPTRLIQQYRECEEQISQWSVYFQPSILRIFQCLLGLRRHHLPAVVQFDEDAVPDEEFTAALQGRASLWREYTLRPILYYVLHCPDDEPLLPGAQALAAKEIDICARVIHRLAFQRRHGGIWFICRKSFMCACLVLTSVNNPHRVQPPVEWHTITVVAIQTLQRWAGSASDLDHMAGVLISMYREACKQRGEQPMM